MQDRETSKLTFTSPSDEEVNQIACSLGQYISQAGVEELLENYQLIISRGRRNEVYSVSTPVWTLFQQIRPHRNPYFLGVFLGELAPGVFQPSLQVLPFLVKRGGNESKVVTTEMGEQRFLYGQHLTKEDVAVIPPNLEEGVQVLVVNLKGEGLGYGRVKRTKRGTITIANHQDLGWYLRRGH